MIFVMAVSMTVSVAGAALQGGAVQGGSVQVGSVQGAGRNPGIEAVQGFTADLICRGRGSRMIDASYRVRRADGTLDKKSRTDFDRFDGAVRLVFTNGVGRALIPDAMLGEGDTRGWQEIRELSVTRDAIRGKLRFNWTSSPRLLLDRRYDTLTLSEAGSDFTGNCVRYDPRAAPPPPYPRPGGGSDRDIAREQAGRADARAQARQAALKADMAFRLFNASRSPITAFVLVSRDGTVSRTWLKPGEMVAPQAFRAMNFAAPKVCSFGTRVTFANGSEIQRQIDYCGKDVLYVSDRDVWAE